jgi:8-oxo-dGTP pyrophosphatase MutT (NUDIX family)
MDKFSKVQIEPDSLEEEELYSSNHIEVIKYKNGEVIKDKDTVAILPYFKYEGSLLMLSEYIQAYQFRNKDTQSLKKVTNYLSVITGSIEEGESVEKTIRRELYEEGGIVLSSLFNIEYTGPFFKSKYHSSHIYFCVLELDVNDYKQTQPPGDGSKSEELSKTMRVSLGDIDNLKVNDIFTQNLLLMLKNEYKI